MMLAARDTTLAGSSTAGRGEDMESLRSLVRDCVDKHAYDAAVFFADKLVLMSGGQEGDVHMLCQAYFFAGQHRRALKVIQDLLAASAAAGASGGQGRLLDEIKFRYLAAKCLVECREWEQCLEMIGEADGEADEAMEESSASPLPGTGGAQLSVQSAIACLRAQAFEALDNRQRAAEWYKKALLADPLCYEALDALLRRHMLTSGEEAELFRSLDYSRGGIPGSNPAWLKYVYESKGKKYGTEQELGRDAAGVPAGARGLGASLVASVSESSDVLTSRAELLYQCCDFKACYEVTARVLERDPYHLDCLPVHLACAVELGRKNDLFLLGHQLVEDHGARAVAWFAVACYYLCVGQYDNAHRYFQKATNLEKDFAPAWMGYGHAFAMQDESDQAMAAYRTATRLFIGCHLPLLCLGTEYMRTNNLPLAEEFFSKAKDICPRDPLVYNELGVLSYQKRQFSIAARYFKKALTLLPKTNVVAWEATVSNLGHAYRKNGKYGEAISMYERALALRPKNASTYSAMGLTYHLVNETHKAIELYHKSLGIRDDAFTSDMLFLALKEVVQPDASFDLL